MLKFKWFGHSMWEISTASVSIIVDPFTDIGYPMPKNLVANIVISSHEHYDHNNFKLITPPFQKISQIGAYQLKDIKVKLIEASHGRLESKNLGDTYLCLIHIDGVSILHCGDLGVVPNDSILSEIGVVDVLLVPVGGKYTIDAGMAKEVIELLSPKIIFPMHYKLKCSKIDIIDTIEPFKALFPSMEKIESDFFCVDNKMLESGEVRIITMNYE